MKVTYGAIVQRASGRFGGTVHSNWKGIDVVRRFAKPTNPDSDAQQMVRQIFRNLTRQYGTLPQYTKAAWTTYATGKPFIARNKYIGVNVPALNNELTFGNLLVTPGDSSTLPPLSFTPTGGVGQITSTVTVPTAPTGWTLTSVIAACVDGDAVPDGAGLSQSELQIYEARDTTNPYAPNITGLSAGDYTCWSFIEWLAPDGSTRYSAPSSGATITVT